MRSVLSMIVVSAIVLTSAHAYAALDVVIDEPTDLGDGLWSHTIHLVADTATDTVRAWDGSFSGPMNQVLVMGVIRTPSLTYASYLSESDQARDSHFLLWNDDLIIASSMVDISTSLRGAFALTNSVTAMDLSLAQVVISQGNTVELVGKASNDTGTIFTIGASISGGQSALGYIYSGPEANGGQLQVGQEVAVFAGLNGPQTPQYIVWRKVDGFGMPSYMEQVGLFDGPEFTFTPEEPGEYVVKPFVFGMQSTNLSFTVVPEPATLTLLAASVVAVIRRRRP